ncbi:interferon alpha/beta receptor 1 isoform X1 [Pipistrellus kuhlii]|uniref:interferon alpha/beta receptor 1 isoform X1 n=1 Tax=Pipistrellus kuhlii TaxID=59472 RepID=UPI001E274A8E|nr:interferon alpha/beta receptor 1 isoform X1 [Pipistrellus kuhlii]
MLNCWPREVHPNVARLSQTLPQARAQDGGTGLAPPQNVGVDIIDDIFTLQWDRSREPPGAVAVSADYQVPGMVDIWTELPGCQHVTSATCDFSSLHPYAYEEVRLRVRAEDGGLTSPWHELDPFVPYQQARIGPPEVHLEAEDKAVAVSISLPGAADGMWQLDRGSFVYSVVIWGNATGPQAWNKTLRSRNPRIKVHGLLPETTYCVTAQARLLLHRNPAAFSPARCVSTPVESELPAPENVKVVLENQTYVLRWDYTWDNVTFQAQWLNSYLKRVPGRRPEKWAHVQGCEHTPRARCALPPGLLWREVYLRVRASHGARSSSWSEEWKFDAGRRATIPPPVVALKALDSHALHVAIGLRNQTELQHLLTYEVRFWENTTNTERTIVEQRTDFPVPGLRPRTVYCAAARALLAAGPRSQHSGPSNTACARTAAGGGPGARLAPGLTATLAALAALLVLCALAAAGKLAHYVFFPAGQPPSALGEYFPEEPLKNLLLPASVERTEPCCVIENADTRSAGGTRGDEDHKAYASQTSQDSGNYSIEDGSAGSGGQGGEELGPPGAGLVARSACGREVCVTRGPGPRGL